MKKGRAFNYRLFVIDKKTGIKFLVDSGADVSLIPATCNDKVSSDFKLYAANGSEIPCFGHKILTLDLGLRRDFQWPFIIAKVSKGILGADFLNRFNLLIDIKNKQLIDGVTKLSIIGEITSSTDELNVSTLNKNNKFSDILAQFPEITKPDLLISKPKHNVKHYITTSGKPVYSKARQLDPKRLEIAKQEFKFMLENDIIRPSKSPWASPLHLVTKTDGTLRPCGDYRRLNDITVPDRYPLPRIEDFHHILNGKKIFSKLDLLKAYYQIPIAEEDKQKTAIITPFGLYEFNVMSFGLRNAPSTFQRFINEVFFGLDFTFPYLDDILIASETEEQHKKHLTEVFNRIQQYGLRINLSKSVTGVNKLEFLGYLITPNGSKPLPEKVQIITNYKLPETIHELRKFLGMINFYRRYLKDAANTQAPLNEYLKGSTKKDRRKIPWTEEAKKSFEKCKEDLANAALLTFPNPDLTLALCTDASNFAIGSVLQQYEDGYWKPIGFYSKKLNDTQKTYSTYDRELLSIYLSIKHFKHLLEGREFTIFTDHKPIIFAFKQKNDKASPRQLRHLQYISQFSTNIKYITGKDNIVADTMSRIESVSDIDYDKIAEEQINNEELKELLNSSKNLNFKQYPLTSGKIIWCDVSTPNIRPFIPQPFRMIVFHKIHDLNHPGIKSSVKQVSSRFIWKNVKKDVREWAKTCISCQKNKIVRHTHSKFNSFEEPDERFSIIHVDIIGPYPPSNGNKYCLTCIDRFTCWMEVIPIENITTETITKAFYANWICRFGVPFSVITDRGNQFRSELFRSLGVICGIKMQTTTSYHPQSNGKVERQHRTLKAAVRAHNSVKWSETLPTILLGIRASLRDDTNCSIAEMVYGKSLKLPGEFFQEPKTRLEPGTFTSELRKQMNKLKPIKSQCKRKQTLFFHKDLDSCSHVFIRVDRVKKALESPYEGPFPVISRNDKYYTVRIKEKDINVSVDRLKQAYLLASGEDDSRNLTNKEKQNIPLNGDENGKKEDSNFKTARSGRRITFPARYQDYVNI